MMQGYLNPLYAQSFSEIGKPLYLPKSEGWLIKRQIPGTSLFDAMGPYPLFFCDNWDVLLEDLDYLKDEIISVSLVIGPFQDIPEHRYRQYFDFFFPYKDHYLLETGLPLEEVIHSKARRDARRAFRDITVDCVTAPGIDLDEWTGLYDDLIQHHQITGIRAFSRQCFSKQIAIPNTHFFRAIHQGEIVGGNLYYMQNDIAYGHLLASTDKGYSFGSSYALIWSAIQHLQKEVSWINLGGGSGKQGGELTGLDVFKRNWSSRTEKSYYCGKILDQEKYSALVNRKKSSESGWFPAYRAGDF